MVELTNGRKSSRPRPGNHQKDTCGFSIRYCDAFSFTPFWLRSQEVSPMGQVIAFFVPPAFPDLTTGLDAAECALLIAIRSWVEAHRGGEDPIPRLSQGLGSAGAPDAAFSVDGLMTVVSRALIRRVEIHCPRCPHVSLDEKRLLQAASLAQANEGHLAEKVLRTTLLSAQGAEFAIGPLEGLGELFAQARLFMTRRRLPAEDQEQVTTGRRLVPFTAPGTTR
jgi:hypothetical protein